MIHRALYELSMRMLYKDKIIKHETFLEMDVCLDPVKKIYTVLLQELPT